MWKKARATRIRCTQAPTSAPRLPVRAGQTQGQPRALTRHGARPVRARDAARACHHGGSEGRPRPEVRTSGGASAGAAQHNGGAHPRHGRAGRGGERRRDEE
jgi:hypothetical protein